MYLVVEVHVGASDPRLTFPTKNLVNLHFLILKLSSKHLHFFRNLSVYFKLNQNFEISDCHSQHHQFEQAFEGHREDFGPPSPKLGGHGTARFFGRGSGGHCYFSCFMIPFPLSPCMYTLQD